MRSGIKKTLLRFASLLLVTAVFALSSPAQKAPERLITKCWQDVSELDMGVGYDLNVARGPEP